MGCGASVTFCIIDEVTDTGAEAKPSPDDTFPETSFGGDGSQTLEKKMHTEIWNGRWTDGSNGGMRRANNPRLRLAPLQGRNGFPEGTRFIIMLSVPDELVDPFTRHGTRKPLWVGLCRFPWTTDMTKRVEEGCILVNPVGQLGRKRIQIEATLAREASSHALVVVPTYGYGGDCISGTFCLFVRSEEQFKIQLQVC